MIQLESNVARFENLAHLGFDHVSRQTVFRNAQVEHPAGYRCGFKNGDRIAHQRQVMRSGQTHRAPANHGHLKWKRSGSPSSIHINRMFRFRTVLLGQESLQGANGNRAIDVATSAGGFTRVGTNSSTDRSKRIRLPRQPVSFLKPSLGDKRHVASGIGVRRTRHHAGEIGV